MSAISTEQAVENIYQSLHNNNENLDAHIVQLKAALAAAGQKTAEFDATKLAQGNRQGRKLMESYFKKRGVTVTFKAA